MTLKLKKALPGAILIEPERLHEVQGLIAPESFL